MYHRNAVYTDFSDQNLVLPNKNENHHPYPYFMEDSSPKIRTLRTGCIQPCRKFDGEGD